MQNESTLRGEVGLAAIPQCLVQRALFINFLLSSSFLDFQRHPLPPGILMVVLAS